MADIQNGKDISYEDITITGELDFTYRGDKEDRLGIHSFWNGFWNGDNTVNEEIDVEISFINCTFEDDVLAYIHLEKSGYTFTADFERKVTFENCNFKENSMFKYSEFDREASFKGSTFNRDNSFKYAEFNEAANFSKTIFDEDAIFKYAVFDEHANFSNARFDEDAIFKYTEFDNGATFNGAEFRESWNIKYIDVSGSFDIERMETNTIDSKYSDINGRSFVKYLYGSRKN